MSVSFSDRVRGCLVGGALGDALGAPTEFLSLDHIRARYGPDGPDRPMPAYGLPNAATDDTQMTLFTAEGLVRAAEAGAATVEDAARHVWAAYRHWYATQGYAIGPDERTGGLLDRPDLCAQRAPGNTCLSALAAPDFPAGGVAANDSKGCGGVMRAAPASLAGHPALGLPGTPFGLGCAVAALTHGHPTGYVSAGAFAHLVRLLLDGGDLPAAVRATLAFVRDRDENGETTAALHTALALFDAGAPPAPETFARLGVGYATARGGGWIAEEALGGAVWAALTSDGTAEGNAAALRLAATHSGDTDSTASIAGNLLGAAYGFGALPQDWLAGLDLLDVAEAMARALSGVPA